RHRRFELVADAVDVHDERRRRLAHEPPTQVADHRLLPARPCAPFRCWAWQIAMASASAASALRRPCSDNSALIMCMTWVFSAPPVPVTVCLTARGAYSNTGAPPWQAPQSA